MSASRFNRIAGPSETSQARLGVLQGGEGDRGQLHIRLIGRSDGSVAAASRIAKLPAGDGWLVNPFRRFHWEGLPQPSRINSCSLVFRICSFGDFGGRASHAESTEFHTS